MCFDSDLTILLTLKDRASFTIRWMNYANSTAFPFKVLIADGGSDENVAAILSDKTRFSNVDYDYVRYPYDKSYADYYTKVANALARIRTPFVAMADNDDFNVVDTLHEAVRFLSVNPDYVSCGGQDAYFWISSSALNEEDALYAENIEWKCASRVASNSAETARARICNPPAPLADFYDVKRTEEARKQFETARDLNLNDIFLTEILITFLTNIAGKNKRLERLQIVRQRNPPTSSAGNHQEIFGNWFERMLVESWSNDIAKLITRVANFLAATDGISIDEARRIVNASFKMHIAPSLLSDILDEPSVTMSMAIVAAIVRHLIRYPEDSIFRKLTRRLYRDIRWFSLESVYGMRTLTTSTPNSRSDLKPILDFLTLTR
jgi:glycosyltransferase domain-containing protein